MSSNPTKELRSFLQVVLALIELSDEQIAIAEVTEEPLLTLQKTQYESYAKHLSDQIASIDDADSTDADDLTDIVPLRSSGNGDDHMVDKINALCEYAKAAYYHKQADKYQALAEAAKNEAAQAGENTEA